MLRVDVRADIAKAKKFFSELNKTEINRAASNALNVVMRTTRNETLDEVSAVRKLKRSVIRAAIRISKRASNRELSTEMVASGGSVRLEDYGARATKRGVTVNVQGTRKLLTDAFMLKEPRGRLRPGVVYGYETRGLIQRIRGAKRRLRRLWGPSVTTGFIKNVVRKAQRAVIARDWQPTFNAKCEDQLAKLRAKYGG